MSTMDLNTEQDGLEASQALPLGRTEESMVNPGWCGKGPFALGQNKCQPQQDGS